MLKQNILIDTIRKIRESGRIALCGYFLVGYPTPEKYISLARAAQQLDVIEFGIPSENPHYDGPVITRAHQTVISERGVKVESALALLSAVRNIIQPKFVMTYTHDGKSFHGFFRMCIENDIHGVFAPDIDDAESSEVHTLARSLNIAYVGLITADMDEEAVLRRAAFSDIIYIKAGSTKTGQKIDFRSHLEDLRRVISILRSYKEELVLSVGIGIQNAEQIRFLSALDIDMAVVGTSLIEHADKSEEELVGFVGSLRAATEITSAAMSQPLKRTL